MMPITAFLTDSTLCIGCKACEVACKEWNERAGRRAGLERILLRQHGSGGRFDMAAREVCGAGAGSRAWAEMRGASFVGIFVGRVQALRECGMPGGVPDGLDRANGIWRRFYPAGCLQRLRILRGVVSVRSGRTESRRRARFQMHVLL